MQECKFFRTCLQFTRRLYSGCLMQTRRKIRELAMQTLFAWDVHGSADPVMAQKVLEQGTTDATVRRQAMEMAEGAWNQRSAIDVQLERLAPQWPPRRQPSV